jgi:PIN domain nuclease of toxin-antitoxin system
VGALPARLGYLDCGCRLATASRIGLSAVTDDRAWTTLDLGVKVVAFR